MTKEFSVRSWNVVRSLLMWIALIAVGSSFLAYAQTRPTGGAQPIADSLRTSWNGAKTNIVESAKSLPEADYSFKPVATVRTYGQILGHLAGANYVFCSAAKGEKSPHEEAAFEALATKAAISKALDDSIAYCDGVMTAMTDRGLAEPIEMPFGMGKGTRTSALLMNINHNNEHYGNLVTYMRMKGIVPPSSRR